MILYAVKYGDQYLRDRKECGIELLELDRASVFPSIEKARALAEKSNLIPCHLIELKMSEKEIPW